MEDNTPTKLNIEKCTTECSIAAAFCCIHTHWLLFVRVEIDIEEFHTREKAMCHYIMPSRD